MTMFVPAAPPNTPPVFDAVGAGAVHNTGTGPFTWTHTAASNAYVIVFIQTNQSVSGTPTYGGNNMTALGNQPLNNNSVTYGWLYAYGLASPPTGSQTFSVSVSATDGSFNGNSISYTNVTSVGTLTYAYGQSTAVSQTVTSSGLGGTALHSFATQNTLKSYTGGNNRYYSNGAGGLADSLIISDALTTTTFSAIQASGLAWAGIGVPLL